MRAHRLESYAVLAARTGASMTIGSRATRREERAILREVSLEIDHVTKRFGTTVALDGLAFEVARGEVFGFLGANGAGKTTTMRICLGIIRADAGEIRWDGRPTEDVPRRTWGYLPEERGLYPRMGVLDQLVYFGSLYGMAPDVARREALGWLARFRIPEYADRRAEELSKGNQQKVQFIAAVLHDPEVLLMDEPFTGLDPVNLVLLREAFIELRDRGRTLIFSTHQMEAAEALCESVAIVDHGRLVAGGRVRDLKRASGRRTLRLAVDGELAPTGSPSCPASSGSGRTTAASRWSSCPARTRRRILAAVLGRAVRRCIGSRSSSRRLEALFIEHVGHPADEDATLAPEVATASLSTERRRPDGAQRPAPSERRDHRPARVSRPDAEPALPRLDGPSRDPGDDGRGRADRASAISTGRPSRGSRSCRADPELAQRAVAIADTLLNVPPGGVADPAWERPYAVEVVDQRGSGARDCWRPA